MIKAQSDEPLEFLSETKPTILAQMRGMLPVAVDTETTGLDCNFHEMCSVALVVLTPDLTPFKGLLPFYFYFKPEHPERIEKKALEVNGLTLTQLQRDGQNPIDLADLLDVWFEKVKKKTGCEKLCPLGHNYQFDKGFIQPWIGQKHYDYMFHYHYRDSMNLALAINDIYAAHYQIPPFMSVSLTGMAKKLGVQLEHAHNAMYDAIAASQVYKALLRYPVPGSVLSTMEPPIDQKNYK